MSNEHFDELDEAKAAHTADNYEQDAGKGKDKVAEPTGKKIPARKADVNKSVDPSADKVEKSKVPGQGMAEAFGALFAEADLSEDFVEKSEAIFESAVNEKVSHIREQLEEEFEKKLEEEVEGAIEDIVEKLDSYLDYAVSHFMEENAVAIERGIQVEMAESFMAGLKDLFVEHNIEIPEEGVDALAEMESQLAAMEEKLEEATAENIELLNAIQEAAAADVFATVAEGLTMVEAERFATLVEGIEIGDIESFEKKLKTVKENYFGAKALKEEAEESPIMIEEETAGVDPNIAAVSRILSNSKY